MTSNTTVTGVANLNRALEDQRKRMVDSVARKAVRAGAEVIAAAMKEAAPVLDKRTANSTALEPGALKADIRARNTNADGEIAALAGPTAKTARVADWVNRGHRMVTGGQSKVLANGKTRGPGKASEVDVPGTYFLTSAYEASVQDAERARDQVLKDGLEGRVK